MKIKELEKISGIPRTTIHFYLRRGLLHSPRKTGRTMAYYDDSHLVQLKKIQDLKKGARVPVAFLKEQLQSAKESQSPASNFTNEDNSIFGKPVPTTREKKKKYRMIIKKAIEIFSKNGYHKTKISDITNALNISTGTFYIYFSNKHELFIEVIDDVFQTIVGDAAVALKEEKDFVEKMKIRGKIFYDNYTQYSEILNQLRAEMTRDSIWPAEKLKKIYHGLTLPVIKDIQSAVDAGAIKPVDPDLTAYLLTGQIEIMSLRMSLDDKYAPEDISEYLYEAALKPMLLSSKEKNTEKK